MYKTANVCSTRTFAEHEYNGSVGSGFDHVVDSNTSPTVAHLVYRRLFQLHILTVFLNTVSDLVLNLFRVVSVSCVVRRE